MYHKTNRPCAEVVMSLSLVLAASALLLAIPASGAEKPTARKLSDNAALVYWQAFAMLPEVDAKARSPLKDWKKVKIDEKVRKLIKQADHSLRLMHKASAKDACDWGVDWDDGLGSILPHLGKARRLGKLAMLRARIHFDDGKTGAALADIVAALRLSRHVGGNGVMVELLVQFAIERDALNMLSAQLPDLTAEQKKVLAELLDRLPAGSDLSRAILAEKAGLMKGKTKKPFLVRALLKDMGKAYVATSLAVALPADQAEAKLAELEKAFGKSPNPFVRHMLPAIKIVFKRQVTLFKQRKTLRAKLLAPPSD
jgi:hypothetical protein